jgi:hypothetical protein
MRLTLRWTLPLVALWTLPAQSADAGGTKPSPQAVEFFETKIRPVLVEHCQSCHGPKKQQAGLRLDSRAAVLAGSDGGPVLVPGQPEQSLLIRMVAHQSKVKMPPKGKLPQAAIDDLTAWVKMGAPWPETPATVKNADPKDAWKKHWAFQPVRPQTPPRVKNTVLVKTPVDAFLQAALEAKGLSLSPAADRRTLLRRVTFDLHGLPPTIEEIEAFERDTAPDAYEKVVDRLLASPRYGERWGRHWLDVARYADTKGYVFTEERRYAYAYTYRDYVIRAFNEDLPYDQFILQQLAADRLPPGEDKRALAAMGFLTLGRRFLNNMHDIIDDRIDVTTRGLLGLTVSCARCHDHKYDPIPTKDYYSLHGVFLSSQEPKEGPLIGAPKRTPEYVAFEKELQARARAVAEYKEKNKAELAANNRKFRDELRALEKKVDAWQASSPFAPPRAMVLEDKAKPVPPRVLLRGNPSNLGPVVPRQFLGVLAGEQRQPFKNGSGRLELAQAIASKDNPLTARVLVNRLWQHHFGAGLVTTPSDFGLRSDPPSNPELLDYLARRFVDEGWSIKKMHRLMLLSNAYRQQSRVVAQAAQLDPENRLLWRMNPRRLDFEAMRDGLLAVSGKLDLAEGGPAVDIVAAPFSGRRTVYGFIERQNLPGLFRTFDFASPDATTAQRYQTTVPQQALFLMNSPFVLEQARLLANRTDIAAVARAEDRIQKLYRRVFGRAADADEVQLGLAFLQAPPKESAPAGAQALGPWERYAQVLLLSNEFMFVD